jgi:hypothetical protein
MKRIILPEMYATINLASVVDPAKVVWNLVSYVTVPLARRITVPPKGSLCLNT